MPKLNVWTNAKFPDEVFRQLKSGLQHHQLILASSLSSSNLISGQPDPLLEKADVAFGQPPVGQLLKSTNLRWVHLTSAGFTAYDRDDLRQSFKSTESYLTTSSGVYDEPCAQHVLAMMMSFARQLPQSLDTQRTDRSWPSALRRANSFLLCEQTAVVFGYGEIAKRLCELLAPMRMTIIGVRRKPRGDEPIQIVRHDKVASILSIADHVINLLPSNDSTDGYFGAELFSGMKPGAFFSNIGRGATVDQEALVADLDSGRIAGAYLDVMTPEPLPSESPLWTHPKCWITPHTAGGFKDEMHRLVEHFLANLSRFEAGEPLMNQVI